VSSVQGCWRGLAVGRGPRVLGPHTHATTGDDSGSGVALKQVEEWRTSGRERERPIGGSRPEK
jgi:hypothetical protein